MPFAYKFNMSFNELKKFLTVGNGAAYMNEFKPTKKLLMHFKGKSSEGPSYLVTDADVFPPNRTHPFMKLLFNPLDQESYTSLCLSLSLYVTEGDLSLVGGDELNGGPSIIGNLN